MTLTKPQAITICAILLLLSYMILPASAADKAKPVYKAEAEQLAPAKPSLSGCYGGVSAGAVAAVMDPIFGVDGYQYGGVIGCDLQVGRLILGVDIDYAWKHVTAFSAGVDAKEWSSGVRAGFALTDNTILFGRVGRPHLSVSGMDSYGLAVGGGLETLIAQNWAMSVEYRRETFDDIPNAREHAIMAALKYKLPVFNLFK